VIQAIWLYTQTRKHVTIYDKNTTTNWQTTNCSKLFEIY